MNTLTIAHLSDLHLPFEPQLRWRARLSKRQLSVWSWRRRGALQRPEILAALRDDVRAHAPDGQIVITGDLTNFALPEEFRRATAWLRTLAPPDRVSVVPGNHDALVAVEASDGEASWHAWTPAQDAWPSLTHRGQIAFIGLSSARPTAPLLARGELGEQQVHRLQKILIAEGLAGRVRVVFLHHPVAEGAVSWRKNLRDLASLRSVLAHAGAELVLHGHARSARLDAIAGPRGVIPCVCVPSSSALPSAQDEGARWHCMRLSDEEPAWVNVQVRRWSALAQSFVQALDYDLALTKH